MFVRVEIGGGYRILATVCSRVFKCDFMLGIIFLSIFQYLFSVVVMKINRSLIFSIKKKTEPKRPSAIMV